MALIEIADTLPRFHFIDLQLTRLMSKRQVDRLLFDESIEDE
jgi:hypothetical protein